MLNITIQSCGLVLLLILLYLFTQESALNLSGRKLYFYALLSSIVCLSLDIVSIIGTYGYTYAGFPKDVALVICKLYVMSLAFQTYMGFLYAAREFFAGGSHMGVKRFYTVWVVVGEVLIAALPIDVVMTGKETYSYGPSTTATYAVTLVLIASTIVMAFFEKDKLSVRRRRAILMWQACWLVAAVIQMYNAHLLLVGFAVALGMVLIYTELENPHEGIDRVTGLYTANALLDYIGDAFLNNRTFSSMYIELRPLVRTTDPEFKRQLLIKTANYLKALNNFYVFRNSDTEFVLISRGKTSLYSEYERICAGIEKELGVSEHMNFIMIPDNLVAASPDEYLQFPHYYSTEREDREPIIIDREAVAALREDSMVRELIQSALEEGRVEVFYQPFYNVKTHTFTAAEALVRIRDRDGSLIPPGRFIPLAEANGMIVPLGIEIFRQVCEFISGGKPRELGITHIEVNLSIAQFDDENPTSFVMDIIKRYSIEPAAINLEITETASVSTKRIILKNMQKLIAAGIRFSLDDFGTGRSNLDYFVEMPIDIIKFDYSFTQGYFRSDKAKSVIESIIEMMHRMGMSIVSEGVETEEQFDAMCALGVEYIQGFYFSKPIPEKDFVEFVKKNNAHNMGM
ncbi:MAG: EAL domain-containing protein [Lachnospiraceae bacterium]|nr:EAL domain-containing protein [Lachnospiraceae bacterium]